jgi:transcriptional regulator with XRE-family HTH domain
MARTLKDKLAALPEERRARIEAEADRLQAEYRTLKELRKARELTQVQLAEALGIRQATVAQMEKRSDLLLSTLRGYVEAMGGHLRLIVEFPGKPTISLEGLGDADEPSRPRKADTEATHARGRSKKSASRSART